MVDKNYVRYKDKYKVKHPERAEHLKGWQFKPGEPGQARADKKGTMKENGEIEWAEAEETQPRSKLDNFGEKLQEPWPKGTSGNPQGRPRGIISPTEQLKAYLRRAPAEVLAVIESWLTEAKAGNMVAIKELLDRTDGKVAEKHQIEGELPVKLIFVPAAQVLNAPEAYQNQNLEGSKGKPVGRYLEEINHDPENDSLGSNPTNRLGN